MTKEIELTRGLVALVDDEDFDELSKFNWHAMKSRSNFYASRRASGKVIRMHNMIVPPPDGFLVDHINKNSLDNRRCNLRLATRLQNVLNSDLKRTSQFIGVSYKERDKKWTARIGLGSFESEAEAAEAVRRAMEILRITPA